MATLTYLTGWEHGVIDVAGGGVMDQSLNATISTTTVRTGTRALRTNATADAAYWLKNLPASSTALVARCYVRFATFPSATTNNILTAGTAGGNYGAIGFDATAKQFFCTWSGGGTAAGPVIVTNQWYRVEMFIAASGAVDGSVDGTALVQDAGGGGLTLTTIRCGWYASSITCDAFFDDLAVSATAGDYPLGIGYVKGYSPSAVGTHNLDAATSGFFFENNGADVAITTSETTSYQRISDVPISPANGYLLVKNAIADAALYLEYQLADSVEAKTPEAVSGIVTTGSLTAGTNSITVRFRDGASNGDIYSGDAGGVGTFYRSAIFATKPSGGAWTQAAVNALTYRMGFTTDATPVPASDGMIAEVAFNNVDDVPITVAWLTA